MTIISPYNDYYRSPERNSVSLGCKQANPWSRVLCATDFAKELFYFFPKQQILDSPKLKEFADDIFEIDEN